MEEIKLLVVESNPKIAREIASISNKIGFKVIKTTADGSIALKSAIDLKPDLILIDISIQGEMDGIDTAVRIHQDQDIPIIFLIGETDHLDLERLKQSNCDGILFKPPIETELRCIIEMTLSHHKAELQMKADRALIYTTLKSIGDAVITTDSQGLITFLNPVAEKLTEWPLSEAIGKPIMQVFDIINDKTQLPAKNPVKKILTKGVIVGLANHTVLISRKGRKIPIDDSGAPIKDDYGNITGAVLVFRDITEQKKAKQALEFEKTLIDAMLNTFPEYIYFKDLNSHFYRVSKSLATEVFGLKEPKEAIGKSDFDFFPEQFAQIDYKSEQDIIKTGNSIIDKEEKRQWLNGSVSWASSTKMPLIDSKGQIIGTFGISKNITEKKQMQETLRKSEERYRLQFEETMDAIFVADAETGILVDCNRAATVLVGRNKSEIIGQHQRILHPQSEIEDDQSRTYHEHLHEKEGQILVSQIITKSGEIRDVAIKASVFDIENKKVLLGLFRDITEQKRAQEALASERNLLKSVIDNIPDKIYAKDTNGRFIICNKAVAKRMNKSNPDEIIGKTDFDFVDPKLAAKFHADEQAIIKSGEPLLNHEEPLDQLKGGKRWNSATKVPLRDLRGSIIGIIGIGRDITDRKLAEEQREKVILELQEALNKINTLKGLIPICACCKKIRDDKGYWNNVESYIQTHAAVEFTHGICPDCMKKLYPDYAKKKKNES